MARTYREAGFAYRIARFPQMDPTPMTREALAKGRARKLSRLLRSLVPANRFYARKILDAGIDPSRLDEVEAAEPTLRRLPFTTKLELQEDRERNPPFGSNLTFPMERYTRIHHTSGTSGRSLWWLDTPESWSWCIACWEETYRAAGVGPLDRVFFPFSFGPFIGFWAGFDAAAGLRSLAIPGGGMTTAARLRVLVETGATVVAATPTYALRMAEEAAREGVDLPSSSVRAVIVAGEPGGSIPETRQRIETAWGARCYDHCGMTEVGPFGFDCGASAGLHVIESEYIVEVVDPRTGEEAPEGAEGELVITNLGRAAAPVIRYRTGDLVRWTTEPCACGRPAGRFAGGVLGRLDEMIFVRGNNVYPSAVEAIIRRFPEVSEFRMRVSRSAEMDELRIEIEPVSAEGGGTAGLERRVAAALEKALLFRCDVAAVPPGTLPRSELKGRRLVRE